MKISKNWLNNYIESKKTNDELVDLFIKKKINFQKIVFYLRKILKKNIFQKYKNRSPKNYKEIIKLSNYVRLKTKLLCI